MIPKINGWWPASHSIEAKSPQKIGTFTFHWVTFGLQKTTVSDLWLQTGEWANNDSVFPTVCKFAVRDDNHDFGLP